MVRNKPKSWAEATIYTRLDAEYWRVQYPAGGTGMFKGGDIRVARVVGLGRLTLSRRERMVMLWRFLSLPVLELIDVFHERAWGRAGLMIERQPGRCGQTRDYVGPARPG